MVIEVWVLEGFTMAIGVNPDDCYSKLNVQYQITSLALEAEP